MIQFFADQIDQLDLALDQLAVKDRNFDRFALMLIDNVVELVLHRNVLDKARENDLWKNIRPPKFDLKILSEAQGPYFERKVKFARESGLISEELSGSVLNLHSFRNAVYHRGVKHEGILHALAILYFRATCSILSKYTPSWSRRGTDKIPHRAIKYLGEIERFNPDLSFKAAWKRLEQVAESMGDSLVTDLHTDMKSTVEYVNEEIRFLAEDAPDKTSRNDAILESQSWALVFSDEGKSFSSKNGFAGGSIGHYANWLKENYPFTVKSDPIPSWRKRLFSLETEKNSHVALKKYCDFMSQTSAFREQIESSARGLASHLDSQEEASRGN